MEYEAREGDTLDAIAWRHYGTADAAHVHALLVANPGAADLGPELPAGTVIALPDAGGITAESGVVRLWD